MNRIKIKETRILSQKRCLIGEGPLWDSTNKMLYYTNGGGREMCVYDLAAGCFTVRKLPTDCAAFALLELSSQMQQFMKK